MIRAFLIFSGFCLSLGACTQRTICPAFQSAYIYDQESLRKKFSYFKEDSTPKILTASKNRYLVAEAVPYRKKLNSMATIEMKDINPVVPDSLTMDAEVSLADLDRAARSVIDSIYIEDVDRDAVEAADADSIYVITKDKEVRVLRFKTDSIKYAIDEVRYNVDQDNYMWYLRNFLVLPDVRLAQMQQSAREEAKEKKAKGERKGFFRNLFRKKAKEEADTTEMEPPRPRSEFDFDYVEGEEQERPQAAEQTQPKKGLFSFLKKDKGPKPDKPAKVKKEKKPKQQPEEEDEPEKQEEVEDDGFY